jgi:hypothetical protein
MLKVKATIIIRSKTNIQVYTRDISGDGIMTKFSTLKKAFVFVKKVLDVKK